MTVIIAGDRSNSGKTTITLALLSYLQQRGLRLQSFKVGPDYIDPMFHRHITGRPCRNLDPLLMSEAAVQACFVRHSQGMTGAIIEGVMGLFDGVIWQGQGDYGSTAHLARLLNVPILLVVDCSRLSGSVAALVYGYRGLDPRLRIAGVILNRVGSDRHLELLTAALDPLGIPILGVLRREQAITLPDRHLGLVPTDELPQLPQLCERLAALVADFDWPQLLALIEPEAIRVSVPITAAASPQIPANLPEVTIAIARDRAFNFYYADNLDALETAGARLQFWSPCDDPFPDHVQGLYFGGGFPELFAAELAANHLAREGVRGAIAQGMPTYGECGGFMYLCEALVDFEGKSWPMVGAIPGKTQMGGKLTLGYRQAIALQSTPLLAAQAQIWGHEFHRSQWIAPIAPNLLHNKGLSNQAPAYGEGWGNHQIHGSYLHLHWGDQPSIAQRFVETCRTWR